MEENNKYWLEKVDKICVYRLSKNNIEHYTGEYTEVKEWLNELGTRKESRRKVKKNME